jgi:hypothetical protein
MRSEVAAYSPSNGACLTPTHHIYTICIALDSVFIYPQDELQTFEHGLEKFPCMKSQGGAFQQACAILL